MTNPLPVLMQNKLRPTNDNITSSSEFVVCVDRPGKAMHTITKSVLRVPSTGESLQGEDEKGR